MNTIKLVNKRLLALVRGARNSRFFIGLTNQETSAGDCPSPAEM